MYTALTEVIVHYKIQCIIFCNLSTQQLVKIETPIVFGKLFKFDMLVLTLEQFYESLVYHEVLSNSRNIKDSKITAKLVLTYQTLIVYHKRSVFGS